MIASPRRDAFARRAAIAAAAVVCLALAGSGCEGGGGDATAAAAKQLAEVEELAKEKAAVLDRLAGIVAEPVDDLETVSQQIEAFRGTTTGEAIERRLEPFLAQSGDPAQRKRAGELVERFEGLQARADEILAKARGSFEQAAVAAVERLKQQVEAELAKAKGRPLDQEWEDDPFAQARQLVERFPPRYQATEAGKQIAAIRRDIDDRGRANERAREILIKAARMRTLGAYERAVGILEAFTLIESFGGTPEAEAVAKLLAEVREEAKQAEKERAEEEKIPWQDLFAAGQDKMLPIDWGVEYGEFEVTEGVLVGTAEGTKGAFMRTGRDEWKDYIVEIEFAIMRGGFEVLLHGSVDEEENRRLYERVPLHVSRFARSEWHRVRIEVRGDKRTAIRLDTFDELPQPPELRERGEIGITIDGGGEVKFRAIRIKILSEAS